MIAEKGTTVGDKGSATDSLMTDDVEVYVTIKIMSEASAKLGVLLGMSIMVKYNYEYLVTFVRLFKL